LKNHIIARSTQAVLELLAAADTIPPLHGLLWGGGGLWREKWRKHPQFQREYRLRWGKHP